MNTERQSNFKNDQSASAGLDKGIISELTQRVVVSQRVISPSLEYVLIRAFAMFQQHGIATAMECNELSTIIKSKWNKGQGADPIEILAELRSNSGEPIDVMVDELSNQVAKTHAHILTPIPFASRLMPPTAFYGKYLEVARLCQQMMVPVTFNEDADVIGLTSINTFFAEAVSLLIVEEINKLGNIKPIISISRIRYKDWRQMNEKHFRKGISYD